MQREQAAIEYTKATTKSEALKNAYAAQKDRHRTAHAEKRAKKTA